MLLTLRCVEPQDKAMALGFISFAIGLFGESIGGLSGKVLKELSLS